MAQTEKEKPEKYVAYVSTYTRNADIGIHVYDVDNKAGRLVEKEKVKITNSSYISLSHNGKYAELWNAQAKYYVDSPAKG